MDSGQVGRAGFSGEQLTVLALVFRRTRRQLGARPAIRAWPCVVHFQRRVGFVSAPAGPGNPAPRSLDAAGDPAVAENRGVRTQFVAGPVSWPGAYRRAKKRLTCIARTPSSVVLPATSGCPVCRPWSRRSPVQFCPTVATMVTCLLSGISW